MDLCVQYHFCYVVALAQGVEIGIGFMVVEMSGTTLPRLRIQEEFVWHIMQKRKTVEGRIAKGAMLNVFPGEILRLECGCHHLDVKVLSMVKYKSFKEMLENEGLMNCLPDCADIEAGVAVYHGFPAHEALALRYGVIALRITTDISDATPVRPLIAVRAGRPAHILTKEEIQKLTRFGSGNNQVRWTDNHKKGNVTQNVSGHRGEKRARSPSGGLPD